MKVCPYCNGAKKSVAFVDGIRNGQHYGELRDINCFTCRGTGEVSDLYDERLAIGKAIRLRRVKSDATMLDWAQLVGMKAVEYSHCEHGVPDTEELWAKFVTLAEPK